MACIGFLYPDGMWGNAIRLINVIIAALLAMNFFEPLARLLEGWWPSWTYCWDFIALWGVFTLSIVVLRTVTDLVSRVKVRFLKIVDQIGSAGFAALIGWVMVCFTLTTLHTAPLGQTFLFGAFQAGKPMFLGIMSPDQAVAGIHAGHVGRSLVPLQEDCLRSRPQVLHRLRHPPQRRGRTHQKDRRDSPRRERDAGQTSSAAKIGCSAVALARPASG